jgi:GH25 family lysozyme M1 (1,4-beta-N-acetylmuramidase)
MTARGRSALVMMVALACSVLTAPAQASPTDEDNATLGSQIRKFEPLDPLPELNLDPLATVPGMDVASYQGNVDWASWYGQGKRFAYVKATESHSYTNPYFAQQYNGSYDVGMIRGAYHFAIPNASSGAAQANYFVDNGGGWSADGRTLPGALDVEYNPYGQVCYDMSGDALTAWIKDFSDTYHARTGRYPVIYTSTNWWNQCVSGTFGTTNPLWIARYADSPGELPRGWLLWTFWQHTSDPLDQNTFNGPISGLQALAHG